MKCTIPEISWHNRDPILSVDIQTSMKDGLYYRLATGGTDTHVVIWQLNILDNGGVSVEMLSDLTRHNKAVNAVRFSPNGQLLASSDDDAALIVWKKNDNEHDIFNDESEKDNKEHWSILKMLRSHIEDIYDLSWSSCSQFLISGSVDNSAILWDISKGKNKAILKDHKGFVQGVAFDPKGQLAATLSSDRFMRIYNISLEKVKLLHRVHKASLQSNLNTEEDKLTRLFYDDTLKSFCRRLTFSPDGELLVVPSGILENADGRNINVTHIFLRSCLNRPVMCFPTHDKYTIAVRFCPQLFELRKLNHSNDDNSEATSYTELFNLPYRMVFAVATQNAVLIYDTQQPIPFAKVSNIHYTRLSDLSWSSDGKILVVSSTDGYCSLISFTEGELGKLYQPLEESSPVEIDPDAPEVKNNLSNCEDTSKGTEFKVNLNTEDKMEHLQKGDSSLSVAKNGQEGDNTSLESPLLRSNSDKEKTEEQTQNKKSPKEKIAMPIAVKRKSGKRVELITLTSKVSEPRGQSNNSTDENIKEGNVDKDEEEKLPVSKTEGTEEDKKTDKPKKESSVAEAKTQVSRTPRRVSLITLSSPKGKKTPHS